jgi:hypothetical protein
MVKWKYDPAEKYCPVHMYTLRDGTAFMWVERYQRSSWCGAHVEIDGVSITIESIRGVERAKAWCVAMIPLLEQARAMKKGR